jgi:hypothetical protein
MDRIRALLASPLAPFVVALTLGVAVAFALVTPAQIDPTNVSWIFGDAATHYSAWEQYRHDSHAHVPLPWTERIGYPVGTSVALLDAIPIAAIVLRPLSPWLPVPFQYLGLWMLLSFVLQAYVGFNLCRRLFPADPVFALIGSVFLLLSTPLAFRVSIHVALCSHWLILAALDVYFRDPGEGEARRLSRAWMVLALAAGINPYLAAMCFIVVLGCVGRLVFEHRSTWRAAVMYVAITFGVVIASGATLGALGSGDPGTYWAAGYGRFSLNLNAPINPMGYSSLLPTLPLAHPDQREDYSYLGLGIIGLLAIGLARRPRAVLWLTGRRVAALVGVAAACAILAASTEVTFGARTLLTIPLPTALDSALQGLRASGRLFWPAYYLIVIAALSLTFGVVKPRHRVAILTVALALQFVDLLPLFGRIRARGEARFDSPLTSSAWNGLGRRYDNLILIPAYQCDPFHAAGGPYNYVYFGRLAALERLRLNSYYASRYVHEDLRMHCVDLLRAQLLGELDPRSVYVVSDDVRTVWEVHGIRSHRCQGVDGRNLCTAVPPEANHGRAEPPPAPPYRLDTVLDFTNRDGDAPRYLTFGWRETRSTGTWTEGPLAMARLRLDPAPGTSRALTLEVEADPFLSPPRHPALDVDVVVNGRQVARWHYSSGSLTPRQEARISADVIARHPGLDVELRIRNPESPLYMGAGFIPYFLGLNVRSLVVRQAER